MPDSDATEALVDIAMNCATFFSVFISLSFAYFTVAYLVGRSLTRFQLTLISAVYTLAQLIMGSTMVIWVTAFEKLHAREETILREISWLQNVAWTESISILMIAVFLASLYFMYDVRRSERVSV